MIVPKIINNDKIIKLKTTSNFPPVILANLQEKRVIPTKEIQEVIADEKYDGLSKVVVEPIPDNYQEVYDYFFEELSGSWYNAVRKLPKIKLASSVKNCSNMFDSCKLESLDLSEFDTSNVTNMSYMFSNSVIHNLDVSSFDTSNVTNMSWIFNTADIPQIDLSSFETPQLTNVVYMFHQCTAKIINVSNMTNNGIKTATCMFARCTNLERLDIRNFDFTILTGITMMFLEVPTDCLIIVKDDMQKNWFETNYSTLTNIKTVAELDE